jgi:hypothetical protein
VNLQFRAEALNAITTNGAFAGDVFEITGVANTGRDGLVKRAFRLGLNVVF